MSDKIISKNKTENLGELARITVSSSEVKELQNDLQSILSMASKLTEAGDLPEGGGLEEKRNVFRNDEVPHKPGEFTASIIKNAPAEERGFIKVKKVL